MTTEVTAVEGTASNAGKKMYYQFNDSGNVICVRDELGFAKFTKYASGIENKPSEESKLRKAVVNRLRRADFASQWTAVSEGGTAAKDASNLCLNCNSIKMTKTAAGEVIYRQPVTLRRPSRLRSPPTSRPAASAAAARSCASCPQPPAHLPRRSVTS